MKKYELDQQVYVGLDGVDGIVIQTSYGSYMNYYRLLGYELLGPAKELPLEVSV